MDLRGDSDRALTHNSSINVFTEFVSNFKIRQSHDPCVLTFK